MDVLPEVELARIAREEFAAVVGREPEARVLSVLVKQYAEPYGERVVRHQTLEWAANAARRRGWTLRLFGSGWERHPTLSGFAAGPLEHGEQLRECYRRAGVHLHMSLRTAVHQRVLECAASGGVPLCRLTLADVQEYRDLCLSEVYHSGLRGVACDVAGRSGVAVADHPALMRLTAARQRLGLPTAPVQWYLESRRRTAISAGPRARDGTALWVLGESGELLFQSEAELEERAAALVGEDGGARRRGLSGLVRARLSGTGTYGALVEKLIGLMARGFAVPAGAGEAA